MKREVLSLEQLTPDTIRQLRKRTRELTTIRYSCRISNRTHVDFDVSGGMRLTKFPSQEQWSKPENSVSLTEAEYDRLILEHADFHARLALEAERVA